ncbi:MAG: hypothetical protein MUP28_03095 [Candidatus Aminicenantes bacterium]|nr:hypothetical protein [Candidatus Aminicenantes bacterium]
MGETERYPGPGLRMTDIGRLEISEDVFERFGVMASGRTHLASMGIYLFDSGVLSDLLGSTAHEDFGREVIPDGTVI